MEALSRSPASFSLPSLGSHTESSGCATIQVKPHFKGWSMEVTPTVSPRWLCRSVDDDDTATESMRQRCMSCSCLTTSTDFRRRPSSRLLDSGSSRRQKKIRGSERPRTQMVYLCRRRRGHLTESERPTRYTLLVLLQRLLPGFTPQTQTSRNSTMELVTRSCVFLRLASDRALDELHSKVTDEDVRPVTAASWCSHTGLWLCS